MLARVSAGTSPVLHPSVTPRLSSVSPALDEARAWLQRVSGMMEVLRSHVDMMWPPMTMDEASGLAMDLSIVPNDRHTRCNIEAILEKWKHKHDGYRREDAARIFAWLAYERRGIDT